MSRAFYVLVLYARGLDHSLVRLILGRMLPTKVAIRERMKGQLSQLPETAMKQIDEELLEFGESHFKLTLPARLVCFSLPTARSPITHLRSEELLSLRRGCLFSGGNARVERRRHGLELFWRMSLLHTSIKAIVDALQLVTFLIDLQCMMAKAHCDLPMHPRPTRYS